MAVMSEAMKNAKTHDEFLGYLADSLCLQFNPKLFERSDERMAEEVQNILYATQRENPYYSIKIIEMGVIDGFMNVKNALINHEKSRIKAATTRAKQCQLVDEKYNETIPLKTSEFYLVRALYRLTVKARDEQSADEVEDMEVLIKVPRFVNKYYFLIAGNYYMPIFQVVDGSTYNTGASGKKKSVVMKVMFMAERFFRYNTDMKTEYDGVIDTGKVYFTNIFSKWVPVFKYIFAQKGYDGAMALLNCQYLVRVSWEPCDDANFYSFKSHNIYIIVNKKLYNSSYLVQSIVNLFYTTFTKNDTPFDVYRKEYWLKSLGKDFNVDTVDKGYEILASLMSNYDRSTQRTLKLPDEHKRDMIDILIWCCAEFDNHLKKDNMDLENKRLRLEEYYGGTLLATPVSKKSFRISAVKTVHMDQIKKAIYVAPDFLLRLIMNDPLCNFKNHSNDRDSGSALKASFSGVSGIGDGPGGAKAVPGNYRRNHHSYSGRFDPSSANAGNPGLSVRLVPTCKVTDQYQFSDKPEPNGWREELAEQIKEAYPNGDRGIPFRVQPFELAKKS